MARVNSIVRTAMDFNEMLLRAPVEKFLIKDENGAVDLIFIIFILQYTTGNEYHVGAILPPLPLYGKQGVAAFTARGLGGPDHMSVLVEG